MESIWIVTLTDKLVHACCEDAPNYLSFEICWDIQLRFTQYTDAVDHE